MKHGTRASDAEDLAICAPITRREALQLLGGAVISIALAGCGSNGGGGNPVVFKDSSRTAITGDLAAQYNQFSALVQQSGDTWLGTSTSLSTLGAQGRSSRAPADVKIVIQVLNIGMNGTRAAYERLCNLALTLDDLGSAANSVTKNFSLTGANAVNNEQWLAAMIAQNYAAVSVTGTLFVMQMVAGLEEARAWALSGTTDPEKLVMYGLVADVFNTWVDALSAAGNITPQDAWKLDLTNAVAVDNIAAKLGQIDTILPLLPFSPGYRKPGVSLLATDDDSLGATGIQNFAQSFTGALARLTLSAGPLTDNFPQTADTTKSTYDVATRLGQTGVGQKLAGLNGGLPGAQQIINTRLLSTDGTTWPGVTGATAQGQVQLVGKIYGFVQALSTALITTQSALGTLITGAQATQALNDLDTTIAASASGPQKALWASIQTDLDRLKKQQLFNGSVPTTRKVDVVRVTGRVEMDQISASGVVNTTLVVGVPDLCPLDPQHPDIPSYRIIISGISKLPNCPRTFRNVLICIAGLLYDIAKLYPDTVNASWGNNTTVSFFSSDFVRVLRREPQASFSEIPAITSAQLLCSGVGFIPSKSLTPLNLATIPKMPDLQDITGLVGGVPINVH